MKRTFFVTVGLLSLVTAAFLASCGQGGDNGDTESGLTGIVRIDGSSTVFPITEAVAEEFQREHRGVRVTVGISGTGGGFKKFCVGETDLNDASRTIKDKEIAKTTENGIQFIELPVAFDGISVLVNPKNDFVDYMTVEELRKIWQPGSTVKTWSDVRPGWPNQPIRLYGPGTDSGTFDYFTKAINGKEQACRPDFTASEDDNVLVQGIAGDENALGFFGYAYYAENRSLLKPVPIETGSGPVGPSEATINDGSYNPLSRPIFIYVSSVSADKPEVEVFVKFYLAHAKTLVSEVGYVPLPDEAYELALQRFEERRVGSIFGKGSTRSIMDILRGAQ